MGTPIKFMDKVVGILRTDKVFITYRKTHHYFRKYNGFGLSYQVIKNLRDNSCRKIIILWEKEDGTTEKLLSTPELFLEKGAVYRDGENDNQRILSLDILRSGSALQKKLEVFA